MNFFVVGKRKGGVGVGGVLFRKFSNFEIVNVRKVMTRVECFKTFSKHVYRDCVYIISTAQKTCREYKTKGKVFSKLFTFTGTVSREKHTVLSYELLL